jgi:hypothetical protein
MGFDRLSEVGEDGAILQTERLQHRQYALEKAAAVRAVATAGGERRRTARRCTRGQSELLLDECRRPDEDLRNYLCRQKAESR